MSYVHSLKTMPPVPHPRPLAPSTSTEHKATQHRIQGHAHGQVVPMAASTNEQNETTCMGRLAGNHRRLPKVGHAHCHRPGMGCHHDHWPHRGHRHSHVARVHPHAKILFHQLRVHPLQQLVTLLCTCWHVFVLHNQLGRCGPGGLGSRSTAA